MFMFSDNVIMTRSLSKFRNGGVIWSNAEDAAMDRYMDWMEYLIHMKARSVIRRRNRL